MDSQQKTILASLGKAALAAIPTLGGPLGSLLNDVIVSKSRIRLNSAIEELGQRLRAIEMRKDDPYATLLITALRAIAGDHRDFKRAILLNVLENAATSDSIDLDLHQYFANLVDSFETHHVVTLREMRNRRGMRAKEHAVYPQVQPHPDAVVFGVLRDAIAASCSCDRTLADDLAHEAVSSLERCGLVISAGTQHGFVFGGSSSLTQYVRNSEFRLSKLGLQFVLYLGNKGAE